MPDAIDEDGFVPIVDFIENPVFPATDAIGVLGGKLLWPKGPRFGRKKRNTGCDSLNLFLWK
jgi:hypothetical protein